MERLNSIEKHGLNKNKPSRLIAERAYFFMPLFRIMAVATMRN
jgi:hypothetical protein